MHPNAEEIYRLACPGLRSPSGHWPASNPLEAKDPTGGARFRHEKSLYLHGARDPHVCPESPDPGHANALADAMARLYMHSC